MFDNRIDDITKKTQRYWFDDGIWDIGFGLVLLLMGLFNLLIAALPEGGLASVLGMGQIVIFLAGFLALGKLVRYFKERITYPRTGYVAYRKGTTSQRAARFIRAGVLGILFSAGLVFVTSLPAMTDRIPAISGLLLGLATLYLGYRFGVNRYYVIGLLTVLLGTAVSLLVSGADRGTGMYFTFYGLLWMAAGGLALWGYLRGTRPGRDEEGA